MLISFADISFYNSDEFSNAEVALKAHESNLKHLTFLPKKYKITVYKHLNSNNQFEKNNILYYIKSRKNSNFIVPVKTILNIIKNKHDVLFIHGLQFGFLIFILNFFINKKTKIFVQHHAEKPFAFPKILFQKLADSCVDKYFFVSKEQAIPFLKSGVIGSENKIIEMMEGSTTFTNLNKDRNENLFIWVGRLNNNKDPLTILRAFEKYILKNKLATLKMIYSSMDLLKKVEEFITTNSLEKNIQLIGEVEHCELEKIYNEATYFILGSLYEGSGYSLCEAMACGCIPIVTNISSFRKMTNNGECGILFNPKNEEELYEKLIGLDNINKIEMRNKVSEQFKKNLSFESIAHTIISNVERIT